MVNENQVYLITNDELNKLINLGSNMKRGNFVYKYIRIKERKSKTIVIEDFRPKPYHVKKIKK